MAVQPSFSLDAPTKTSSCTEPRPKVSVVVPVFNTGPFLPRCLKSLCAQTLREIEIVVVNDGSTDDSGAIIERFAAQDCRIRSLSFAENRGTFQARLAGMQSATGELLGTVDSDDWVDAPMYETMYQTASEREAEIVECRLVMEKPNGRRRVRWADRAHAHLSGDSIVKNVLDRTIWHVAANKIFSRSLWEKSLWFLGLVEDKIVIADDKLLTIPMFYYAQTYTHLDQRFYHYCYRRSSTTNNRRVEHDLRHIRDTRAVDSHLRRFFDRASDGRYFDWLRKNEDQEVMIILGNIARYDDPSSRDRLYRGLLDTYDTQALSVLHSEFERLWFRWSDDSGVRELVSKMRQHLKLATKEALRLGAQCSSREFLRKWFT